MNSIQLKDDIQPKDSLLGILSAPNVELTHSFFFVMYIRTDTLTSNRQHSKMIRHSTCYAAL